MSADNIAGRGNLIGRMAKLIQHHLTDIRMAQR
jgi:hypothetical protein